MIIVTIECPLFARCISKHFTCFNTFKPHVSLLCFYNSHRTTKDLDVIWIPAVWLLSQFGVSGKWPVRWRLTCRTFIRASSWNYHLWNVKKRREGRRIGQREKWDCGSVSVKASADPVESFEDEIALQNRGKGPARPSYPSMHQSLDLDWPGKGCMRL